MLLRYIAKYAVTARLPFHIKNTLRHYRTEKILPNFVKHVRKISYDENEQEVDEMHNEHDQFDQLILKYLPDVNREDPVMTKILEIDNVESFLKISTEVDDKDEIVQLLLKYGQVRSRFEPTVMKNIKEFLQKIDSCVDQMSVVELAVCLLHMRLLSVDLKTEVPQKIIEKIYNNMKEEGAAMNSVALMLFTETLMLERSLYSKLIMVEAFSVIFEKLTKCDNALDCYLIACSLNNIHPVISMEALHKTKNYFNKFLDQGLINEDHPKVIFKILNYLNYPYWSASNSQLMQKLLLVLPKSIPKMTKKELLQTHRALFAQYEPAKLVPLLRDRANELLSETKDVELLQIVCSYCTPDERQKYVEMLKDKVLTYQTTIGPGSDSLSVFFKILRLLRISDTELCDCLWTKIVNKIFSLRETELKHKIPKYFYRYMNFNNNLGGTYRHIEFEKIVTEYCLEEMRTNSTFIPRDFVKFASFVIAYNDQYDSIPNFIIEKLIQAEEQFDIFDIKVLSRSLEILHGFKMKLNSGISKVLDDQIEILQYVLSNCSRRHLNNPEIKLKQVNLILSSFVRRRGLRDSQLFYDIMKWYDKPNLELDSRAIREICHSVQISKFAHDTVCDQFFTYILNNSELVTGETVEKVLTTCYNLSYFPENPEALECCSEIIHRDFSVMNGLSIVQALIALTFYKAVPFELVSKVFQSDFIKKLEQEIQMAYRLETYPQRVMTLVMQLNRAICLDFPEYNIRWFQQNFIEAQMSKKPAIRSKFQEDIRQLLLQIVPGREYLAVNQVTPYGYRIDFEIHIDNYNKFLKPNPAYYQDVTYKPQANKIAILLLGYDSTLINNVNRLKGDELLRMRHLEMMNYKVVHVKKSDFGMLYENISAKIKQLRNLLQISA